MAAKEKDNSHGNKKLEYLDQNSKPELHKMKAHHWVLKAAPSVHICSGSSYPQRTLASDNTTDSTGKEQKQDRQKLYMPKSLDEIEEKSA